MQAPYKIQPLFPFSRSTAYAILSSDARPPSHVWLRGTTPEGDELELEIAVQRVPVPGETMHQLAQNLSTDSQSHTSTPPSPLPPSPTQKATLAASPHQPQNAHSSSRPSAPKIFLAGC